MTENVSRVQRDSKIPVVNLPNALTMARLVLVPIFVILALQNAWAPRWAAFVVFALAAITDRFDGQLARSWNQITDFGRIVDPIADKALTLCITAMRGFFLRRGVVVSANNAGKLKTFMQIIALGTLLIPWEHFFAMEPSHQWWVVLLIRLGQALAGVALALTIYSGIGYIVEGVRLMRGTPVGHSDEDERDDSSSSGSPLAGQHVQA